MAPFDDITELAIAALVERFYSKARRDPLIGPVFNAAVEDWDEHLHKLRDFWSSVMLTTGRYKGNPMAAHVKHPIEPAFFERWLALWRETAGELFAPIVSERALRLGDNARNPAMTRKEAAILIRGAGLTPCERFSDLRLEEVA